MNLTWRQRQSRRWPLVAIITGIAAFAAIAVPGHAQAASTVPPAAVTRAAAAVSVSSAPSGPAAGHVIVCTPQVQNPHKYVGLVNVVVTLKCTSVVTKIGIQAALYFNGHLVKASGLRTVMNSSSAGANAAVPCRSGTYQGWMEYGVFFPRGYHPPTGSSSGYGRAVSITC
jgi:hypothetical protein